MRLKNNLREKRYDSGKNTINTVLWPVLLII